jgi:dipeptidyl-peptidase-3
MKTQRHSHRSLTFLLPLCLLALPRNASPQRPPLAHRGRPPGAVPTSLVQTIGKTGIIQLEAPSFGALDARQKHLAYWLSRAAIAIDPIIYDQLSPWGTEEKELLEGIAAQRSRLDPPLRDKVMDYIELFWVNHSNYNSETAAKFVPGFTPAELRTAAEAALAAGAWRGSRQRMQKMLADLQRPIFDASFAPHITDKNPPPGQDIITASANNFYSGVTLADLAHFHELYPLNSRVVKANGKIVEQVYRAGTPDGSIPPGLYAPELRNANAAFEHALAFARPGERKPIRDLIRYYQTGSPADWHQFDVDWVRNNPTVDFANGFIEVYMDARGQKGTSQSFVTVTDASVTKAMKTLAANASYFEQHDPWKPEYKNPHPNPPLAKAVEAVAETGDFTVFTIGDNLPNEQDIHQKYGTKSFIFTASMRAFDSATGLKTIREFSYSPEEVERARKYHVIAEQMFTAMHEVIGHGSGRLSARLQGHDPADFLKEYYSTLEESRADLVALWSFWDPKLLQLGLIPNQDVAREAYDSEARAALVQLREVPTGDTIQEDHRRGTQLIVNYIRDKTGAIQPRERDGKVYLVVTDYAGMRKGVGMLLAELMRIKAEGDYNGIRDLVTKYGIHFNTSWRDQVVARTARLNIPTYWGGVNPDLELRDGTVTISYPRDLVVQRLDYARLAAEKPE